MKNQQKKLVDKIMKPVLIIAAVLIIFTIALSIIGPKIIKLNQEKSIATVLQTGTPVEKVNALIVELNPQTFKTTDINVENNTAIITVYTDDFYSVDLYVTRCCLFGLEITKKILDRNIADTILVKYQTTFFDNKGNEKINDAVRLRFTRESMKDINFENFKILVSGDIENIKTVADLYLHAATATELAKEKQQKIIVSRGVG